ncbi:AcrR family transcriptional regulator [Kineosphaera limosa]|uniref:Putative TetR family transcriptional regulator n=1 Tax=Kineosphaera limosa NBRC 100340 TaxID=1184609 RepID=K6W745_9MICO|nr:TetR family transcriptional regulator [Kineosphaera limosa]NYE00519.1 AcrR family transcriptional regulator [Kineosphaera limosa]GAB95015.1 putative TetR family transcriptional regulator [Kineosphaera limosa NBRC 100340]
MAIDSGGRTGRRPGSGSSRDEILQAAREQFTEHGFKGATLRAIAAQAGVDPGLIRHFFGDKAGLFTASLELPPEAVRTVLATFSAPSDEWGVRATRAYFGLWEDPETAGPLRATVVSAFANDQALERLRDFLAATVLQQVTAHLPQDDPGLRLTTAMTHLLGVAIGRYLLQVPPLVAADLDDIVAMVAPTIQHYLTGPLPSAAAQT